MDIYCDKKKIKKKDRDGKKRKIDVENNEIKNVFNNIFIWNVLNRFVFFFLREYL